MRRKREALPISLAGLSMLAISGCGLVYLPSEEAAKPREVTNTSELKRQLVVFVGECNESGATGTVRNRATQDAMIILEVKFGSGPAAPIATTERLRVEADGTANWQVDAPVSSGPATGCEPVITSAELGDRL
jgi:hypothetical protein